MGNVILENGRVPSYRRLVLIRVPVHSRFYCTCIRSLERTHNTNPTNHAYPDNA